jgi:purine-cytosine permease-like protein
MKKTYIYSTVIAILFSITSCSDFLDQNPDKILTEDQVFSDAVMIESVLANFYGRISWGQHVADYGRYTVIDEAAYCIGGRIHALLLRMIYGGYMSMD